MKTSQAPVTAHGLTWHTSSYSGAEGGQCVEVATVTDSVFVRDSKLAAGPVVAVSPAAWAGFLALTKSRPALRQADG
jgi:hypothetical protein